MSGTFMTSAHGWLAIVVMSGTFIDFDYIKSWPRMVSDSRYVSLLMLIVEKRQKLFTTEGEHNGSYKLANERYEVELVLR
ncbi:hypothetical protein K0625_21975 [Shewanella sp. NR704-98]|uniref:Uncharacterized protein n=2 Tax=Shewanella nanhaiensis TaxID=2864872 RepID=A0ABS7E9Q5_9GAMM|nr:hypothetical protein [Shewanella nanhaiensis]